MSSGSGTPTGGGYMRQRYSHGYASSGDDLEDDACSILQPQSPIFPTTRTSIENVVWNVSAVFIIYLGDCHSNLIYLLFHDDRIRRLQMYLAVSRVVLNVVYVLCTGVLALDVRKSSESLEMLTTYSLTFVTILGLIILFCFVAYLEFLHSSSCVHIVNGFNGDTVLFGHQAATIIFWFSQAIHLRELKEAQII
ncbi:hypothetical protein L1987_20878 [Smallanthus sonchifolius]|uniref:Uncharacterized protein n=1 Tax=Smallanthus sonchifolius TaxID=185202 RepID=A0ACB9ITK7_9ASTR|nr:hypothetical protein L1987_20878 [Smallanthus sonchifolius]